MTPDTPEQAAVRAALALLCFRASARPDDASPAAASRVYAQLVAEGVRLATEQDAVCPVDCAVAQWLRKETGLSPEGWPRLFVGQTRVVLCYRTFDADQQRVLGAIGALVAEGWLELVRGSRDRHGFPRWRATADGQRALRGRKPSLWEQARARWERPIPRG